VARLVALLAAGALVLSACSGDDETDTTASPETTTTTAIEIVEDDPASVSADPSAGCGGAATTPPGETEHDITSGEIEGTYAQYVPTAHDGDRPVPLVLDLHGLVEGGPIHAAHTQLGPLGAQEGFVTNPPDANRDPGTRHGRLESVVEHGTPPGPGLGRGFPVGAAGFLNPGFALPVTVPAEARAPAAAAPAPTPTADPVAAPAGVAPAAKL